MSITWLIRKAYSAQPAGWKTLFYLC